MADTQPAAHAVAASRRMPCGASFAAEQTPRGRVSLFTGCVSRAMDRATEITIARLLARLGYVVDVPHDQVCCGALDQHAGRAESAQKLARQNCRAFGANDTVVLSTATGCTATLLDYGRLAAQDGARFGPAFAISPTSFSRHGTPTRTLPPRSTRAWPCICPALPVT